MYCKMSLMDFGNYRNLKFSCTFFVYFQEVLRTWYVHGHERACDFSNPGYNDRLFGFVEYLDE